MSNSVYDLSNFNIICKNIGQNPISIGTNAGLVNQGTNSIAIGVLAGQTSQHANSIVLNATGAPLNTTAPNSTYIAPVRNVETAQVSTTYPLQYDINSKELTYTSNLSLQNNLANELVGVTDYSRANLKVNGTFDSWDNLFNNYSPQSVFNGTIGTTGATSSMVDISIQGLGSGNKWMGGTLTMDKKIVGIPWDYAGALIIDPTSPISPISGVTDSGVLLATYDNTTRKLFCPGASFLTSVVRGDNILIFTNNTTARQPQYTGYVQYVENNENIVFMFALGANLTAGTIIGLLDTRKVDITSIIGLTGGSARWAGGVLYPDNKIYCAPWNAARVLILDINSPIVNIPNVISTLATYDNAARRLYCPGATFLSSLIRGDNIIITIATNQYMGYVSYVENNENLIFIDAIGVSLNAGDIIRLQKTRKADFTTIFGFPGYRDYQSTSLTNTIVPSGNNFNLYSLTNTAGNNFNMINRPLVFAFPYYGSRCAIIDPYSPVTTFSGVTNANVSYNNTTNTLNCPGANFLTSVLRGDNILIETTISGVKRYYTAHVQVITDNNNVKLALNLGTAINTGEVTSLQKTRKLDMCSILGLGPGPSSFDGRYKFMGSALAPNGKLYGVPYTENRVAVLDLNSPVQSITSICGNLSLATYVSTDSSKILTCSGSTFIGNINVGDNIIITNIDSVTTGYVQTIIDNQTLQFYNTVVATGTFAAGTITNIERTRKLDIHSLSGLGTQGPNDNKFAGAVTGLDGKIYMIPNKESFVLIVDPDSPVTSIPGVVAANASYTDSNRNLTCTGATFTTTIAIGDNLILDTSTTGGISQYIAYVSRIISDTVVEFRYAIGITLNTGQITNIRKTRRNDITSISGLTGDNKWHGGTAAPDGKIYCAGASSTRTLIIDPNSPVTSIPGVVAANASYNNTTRILTCPGATFTLSSTINVGDNILIFSTVNGLNMGYVESVVSNTELLLLYAIGGNLTAGQITNIQKTRRADITSIVSTNSYIGSVYHPNGRIYEIPISTTTVKAITPGFPKTPPWMLSPYYNKSY